MEGEQKPSPVYAAYLRAVKANQEYQKKLNQVARERETLGSIPGPPTFRTYLELLKWRKLHQKAEIIRHYVYQSDEITVPQAHSPPKHEEIRDDQIESEEARRLYQELQIAILKAQHQVEHSKTQRASGSGSRTKALSAVQQELTNWIEERLVEEDQPIDRESADLTNEILEEYQKYLNSRQTLLNSARPTELPAIVKQSDGLSDSLEGKSGDMLHIIQNRLLPLLKQQDDLHCLQEYVLSSLNRERNQTLAILNHLAGESHLLSTTQSESQDEIDSKVEAWSIAVRKADEDLQTTLEAFIVDGMAAVKVAERSLEKMEREGELNQMHEPSYLVVRSNCFLA